MNEKDISEQAYKNGYEKGKTEAKAEIERLTEYNANLNGMCLEFIDKNAELQKQVDELKELNAKYLDSIESVQAGRCRFRCELTEQAVKDTAKEILDDFDKHCVYSKDYTDFMRKEYGVEVQE